MNSKIKRTKDNVAEEIRLIAKKLGHIPKNQEMPQYLQKKTCEYFGKWKEALRYSLGDKAIEPYWTKAKIDKVIKDLYLKLERYPKYEELPTEKLFEKNIYSFYKSINDCFEDVLGKSPRTEIAIALDKLTPPRCGVATSAEICDKLHATGIELSILQISFILREMQKAELVESGKADRTSCWWLTRAGREYVKGLKHV